MDTRRLIDRTCERAALASTEEAEGAVVAVLESLAPGLDETTRELLADALPAAWSVLVRDVTPNPQLDREGLCRAVADHERTTVGFGVEHVRGVCQALAEAAPEDLCERLGELPRGLGELFIRYAPTEAGPQMMPSPHEHLSRRSTLSEGRPGGTHPVSEAPLPKGQRHSVASSDDPHGDTKLSSAQGTTQERQGRTLSEGRPGRRDGD